jgi:hypothetical protein
MGLSNGQSRRLGSARRRRTRAHLSPLNHCTHTRPKLTIRYRRWWVRPLPATTHEASNVAGCHCVHIMAQRDDRHGLAAETLTRCASMGKSSCVRRPVSALHHRQRSITACTPIPLSLSLSLSLLAWLFPPPASAALAHGPGVLAPSLRCPCPCCVLVYMCLLLAHS